jgi:paraquat-inducible protein B
MKKPSATLIGAFVVGALLLLAAAIIIFSKQRFFNAAELKVAYFEGSVNGLGVGAPVKLKGVTMGSVTRIVLQFDPELLAFRSAVFFELPTQQLLQMMITRPAKNLDANVLLKRLIHERGLRAQLMPQSLVTGQLFLGLDFFPDTPIKMYGVSDDARELPSIASSTEQILNNITSGLSDLNELPLSELAAEALLTLKKIEQTINPQQVADALTALQKTLTDIDHLVQNIDQQLTPMATEFNSTMRESRVVMSKLDQQFESLGQSTDLTLIEVQQTLKLAQAALASFDAQTGVQTTLPATLKELSAAARSVRFLADELREQPQSLIFGKDLDEDE